MTRVELFEAIRRDRFVHEKAIRAIARERGVHRRTVRQAMASAIPPARRVPKREPPILTGKMRRIIDEWLIADKSAPKKQRHTARRIFHRLQREQGFVGAESTVRRHVGRRRRELGLPKRAYVPRDHLPGQEGEVDWYEVHVDFPWGREKVFILQVRACYSGREFHMAFPRQTQQAFLEGQVAAFEYFGGIFHRVRYDNLSQAVKRILRGRRREETDRFVAFRSHHLFASEFCRPDKEGAPEKGGVENGVGRFRRNHMVPVPKSESYEELNRMLLDWCAEDDLRRMEERPRTVIEDWEEERGYLLELPEEPFPIAEVGSYDVDSKSRVKVRTNRYSVPVCLVGRRVEVRLYGYRLEAVHGGRVVAEHERSYGCYDQRLKLDHYIELLQKKPGALRDSKPLRQARDAGEWPEQYDLLWDELVDRYGQADGTRELLDVLLLHRIAPAEDIHMAITLALEHGCCDAGSIGVLLRQLQANEEPPEPLTDLGPLQRYERPARLDFGGYDTLLSASAGGAA